MIYLAKRMDTGALVEFEDDPDLAPGFGEALTLTLNGHNVECRRVLTVPQVVATDRRKRFDDDHMGVRSDGRLSSMQVPTRSQARRAGLPEAPYYNRNGEASFMTRDQASDYAKRLSDADPHQDYSFNP